MGWMLAYLGGLIVVSIACVATAAAMLPARCRRSALWEPLPRTAMVLLANWCLGIGFNLGTGITDGWWWSMMIDLGAASVILAHPAGRWQAAVGATYCVQIAMHLGYGLCQLLAREPDPMRYYDWLTMAAWAQLLLMGGWCGSIWMRGAGGGHHRLSPAVRARRERLDPPR